MERLANLLPVIVLLGLLYPVFTDMKYQKVDMRYMILAVLLSLVLQLCVFPACGFLAVKPALFVLSEPLSAYYRALLLRMALSLLFGGGFWLVCGMSKGSIGTGDGAVFFLLATCFTWNALFWILIFSLLAATIIGLFFILLLRRSRKQKLAFVPVLWAVSLCLYIWQR